MHDYDRVLSNASKDGTENYTHRKHVYYSHFRIYDSASRYGPNYYDVVFMFKMPFNNCIVIMIITS